MTNPQVTAFFDAATNTVSYVVADPRTRACAIIDSVLSFDPASGRTDRTGLDAVVAHVRAQDLSVVWLLETHVHADHLSGAPPLKAALGGEIAIGAHIGVVQDVFARVFHAEPGFAVDGSQFDVLLTDGETVALGDLSIHVIATPGHTPACVSYLIGDAVFVGDTLFMPDFGTARTDFPGGDARTLYHSIQRLFALPDETRVFVGHDYGAPGRDEMAWETTIGAQRANNVHVGRVAGAAHDADAFAQMRDARDATLAMPRLLLPSVQVNMRAGRLPPAEADGRHYLKLPIDVL